MNELTMRDLEIIRQVCAPILIDECTPPYLQDFIATRLEEEYPDLSVKIRQMSPHGMDRLCEHVRQNPHVPS